MASLVTLGAVAVLYVGLALHVEGWVGSLVTLGASAVTICRPGLIILCGGLGGITV